ncbi:50S ribosomal protein L34 [Candidatus Woesebacteria bacterium RIFCSPHIGHO2_01_FULL_44_10]|uniref:Large ribosomal subunit protein bL34 n=1 Tax=Candidatus Woesebacteria bacterium RIFCSPLOWO2_01_FULL_44_14 TaxID=1802525 RepID=A0A1F8C1D5_9BACT|nr:MAG: 50S ribosomal protein L34 [Candidatus Woesebacteria bacterium RIFCSPHIGHO2_01_FULL_44_10]OGM53716.1 MAG: 50S ribosomal protein L34 [Candidatus Woesebacteria bacterium RIFCSPHIGHO2_12_FULL_44_11]OGM70062.1 MAG: 50S ribosomal protein L34 [Candidatus Woesebacteria bacterium RIFCSPLOWO2_01_FULL_44_14]
MVKRTYQPSKIKKKRKFGFRITNRKKKAVLKSRRAKGRKRLTH